MKETIIREIAEKTFLKLCAPANGHGMFAEIEKAISEAYQLGKKQSHIIIPFGIKRESLPNRA